MERTGQNELRPYLESGSLSGAGRWLVENHARDVLGLCRALARSERDAEELTIKTFQRAFALLRAVPAESAPRTWLLRVASELCLDHLQMLKRDPWRGTPVAEAPTNVELQPEDYQLPSDLVARGADVLRAIAQQSEGQRALLVLRFRLGLPYEEIAQIFGLDEPSVRRRVFRALTRINRALQPTLTDIRAPVVHAAPGGLHEAQTLRCSAPATEPASVVGQHPLVGLLALIDEGLPPALGERLVTLAQSL